MSPWEYAANQTENPKQLVQVPEPECLTHLFSSSPDDISKNESTNKGPRTGGKGGGLPKPTRGSTFSSLVMTDSLESFSFPCF